MSYSFGSDCIKPQKMSFEQPHSGQGNVSESASDSVSVRVSKLLSITDLFTNISTNILLSTPFDSVPLNVVEECPFCNGIGSAFKHGKQKCETCGGTGKDSYLITGGLPVRGVCPKCRGDKFTFKSRCYECEGKGKILWRKIYSVPVRNVWIR